MARDLLYKNDLTEAKETGVVGVHGTGDLVVYAKSSQVTEWRGNRALRIEDGLVIVPGLNLESGRIEAEVGAECAAYPGIAFHIADPLNFELAYSQPHTSGSWDALQYDPVFHGSNTWQIHHGHLFQKEASIPQGAWYSLRLDFTGSTAALRVNGQPPLVVNRLAHGCKAGMVGLWTFRATYFRNFRIYSGGSDYGTSAEESTGCRRQDALASTPLASQRSAPSASTPFVTFAEWLLDGYGVVAAEPHGLVLLNRYLPSHVNQAVLTCKFQVAKDTRVEFKYGFSDVLSLAVDGITIFSGSNTFSGLSDRDARGYAEPQAHTMAWEVAAGTHIIKAAVEAKEPFGWGFGLSASASERITLIPAWMT